MKKIIQCFYFVKFDWFYLEYKKISFSIFGVDFHLFEGILLDNI